MDRTYIGLPTNTYNIVTKTKHCCRKCPPGKLPNRKCPTGKLPNHCQHPRSNPSTSRITEAKHGVRYRAFLHVMVTLTQVESVSVPMGDIPSPESIWI